ncbi:MAG TPA: hypothetical protein VFL90_12970, partial [Methylomirabilota bacterium]|nr:hypothetical protein [Methylomirabilota bacterium]
MTPGRYRASPAWAVPRRTSLAAWRSFNTTLDEIFYDVGALSPAERAAMVQHTVPEGAVLVVFSRAAARAIRHLTPLGFVAEQHSGSAAAVDTVVVA